MNAWKRFTATRTVIIINIHVHENCKCHPFSNRNLPVFRLLPFAVTRPNPFPVTLTGTFFSCLVTESDCCDHMCNRIREGQSCRLVSMRSDSCLTRDQSCICASGSCIVRVPFYRSWYFPLLLIVLIMIRLTTLLIRLNFTDEVLSRLVTRKLKKSQKKKAKKRTMKHKHKHKLQSTTRPQDRQVA